MSKFYFIILGLTSTLAFGFQTTSWRCSGSGFAIEAITPDLGTTREAARAMQTLYTISEVKKVQGNKEDVIPLAFFLTTTFKAVSSTEEIIKGKNAAGGSFTLTISNITHLSNVEVVAGGTDFGAGELTFKQGPISGDGIGLSCSRD